MLDSLMPLVLPPGIYRNGTVYQSKGRYYDASLVRFFEGTIQPIQGWRRVQDTSSANLATLTGTPRAVRSWRDDSGQSFTAIGTVSTTANQSKLYIVTGMVSLPPAALLFDETVAGGLVAGLVNAGFSGTSGNFGNGLFGVGLFGTGATGGTWQDADTWSLDTFGSSLVAVSTIDQKLYVWAGNTGVASAQPRWSLVDTGAVTTSGATPANSSTIAITAATSLTGTILTGQQFIIAGVTYTATQSATAVANIVTVPVTPNAPGAGIGGGTAVTGFTTQAPLCHAVVVTPERYLMALGAAGNVRLVQWCDRESTTQWGALAVNSAGAFPLKTDGRLMGGAKTRTQTLLYTDIDLWVATWIGQANGVYRFDQAGTNCGHISANAGVASDTKYYWMGQNAFFLYDGYVQAMPCDVADYVFGRLNQSQKSKVWCMSKPQFGEIWWHYPSVSSNECDSYVVYNQREVHWTIGTLSWAAGFENGATFYPILADTSGALWEAEVPGAARVGTPYVASGPIEIGQGDQVLKLEQMVADATQTGGTADVTATIYTALFPTDTEVSHGPYPLLPQPAPMRLTGRQIRVQYTEANAVNWRVGNVRIAAHAGGNR